jgi:hypothetical protein
MMEAKIKRTLKSLEARNFRAWFAENCREAKDRMMDLIPEDATVGIGDSSTVRQIGVIESLKKRGTKVINPFDLDKTIKDSRTYLEFLFRPMVEATVCDLFLTGSNALTEDGRLLSVDAVGNRVAGMFWGHPRVVLAVGKNKIVKNLDEAFSRVKNVVAPQHLRKRGASAPCTIKGKCQDCIGKKRICSVTILIENEPLATEIDVVIVNEDLGLSWDESWPKERIKKIAAKHEKFMWTLPREVAETVDRRAMWEAVKPLGVLKGK